MRTVKELATTYQTSDIWSFPEEYGFLYDFVKKGEKTATSSYFFAYDAQHPLPVEEGYAILLNHEENATEAMVLKYPEVRIYPFKEIAQDVPPAEMMDMPLWIEIHQRDFQVTAEKMGKVFSEEDLTVTKFMKVVEIINLKEVIV